MAKKINGSMIPSIIASVLMKRGSIVKSSLKIFKLVNGKNLYRIDFNDEDG